MSDPSPEFLRARLEAEREALAENVDALISRLNPKTQAQQAVKDAQDFASSRWGNVKNGVSDSLGKVLGKRS